MLNYNWKMLIEYVMLFWNVNLRDDKMNLTETGQIIMRQRKVAGYTQKSLARELNITDKAVSKWERGVCLPDATNLSKLSMLLDIDIEYLISGSKPYGEHAWNGLLVIENCRDNIAGKPIIHYMISYFMLVGIKEIYIQTKDKDYIRKLKLEEYGVTINFGIPILGRTMIVYDKFLLFGANLTRYFENCMSTNEDMQLSLENQIVPVLFASTKGYDLNWYKKKAEIKNFGRGMVYIPLSNKDAIIDADVFVKVYEKYHESKIADLHELSRVRMIK